MTSLEALERIRDFRYGKDKLLVCQTEMYDIIEKELIEKQKQNKIVKAFEIIKEHIKFEDRGIETYTDDLKNLVTKFLIRLESKDTGAKFHIHLDTKEEFDTLKEVLCDE